MMKKSKWFSIFRKVVPADFENWLETLASQGWNIDKIGQFSSIKMTFVKTDPKQYRYVFDLNAFPGKDYINTYKQFGWEFVGQTSSCFVWRKEYTDSRPESFTDKESLIGRNRRVKNAVSIVFVMLLIGIAASLVGIGVHIYRGNAERILELSLGTLLLAVSAAYIGWVVKKIKLNIER